MKKIILIAVIMVIIFCIASFFISDTISSETIIDASFDNVTLQLEKPENWVKWQPALKAEYSKSSGSYHFEKDSSTKNFTIHTAAKNFIIKMMSPVMYEVTENINDDSDTYYYKIEPAPGIKKTKVIAISETNFLYKIFSPDKKINAAQEGAEGLKKFIEDPDLYYGSHMKTEMVVDTVFATKTFVTNRKNFFIDVALNLSELRQYTNENKLILTNDVSVSTTLIDTDSLSVLIGLPVNKTGPKKEGVDCRAIPKGKMLITFYEGKYEDRGSVVKSMEQYVEDHSLTNVGKPFEQFIKNTLPTDDSSWVRIKLYYPIL